MAVTGLIITIFWVKDTRGFVQQETATDTSKPLSNVFTETTFKNKTLSSVTQAGLINNLNDGMIWGLLPIVLMSLQFNPVQMGVITAIYPTVWGVGQLFTGRMSDKYSKKAMLFWGMLLQGLAILFIPISSQFYVLLAISALLGLGTALVYPTFLSTIAQATSPKQRAESIGTFRLWRDLGYAFGAIISGITADYFGIDYAIYLIGLLTILSSIIIKWRMPAIIKKRETCMEVLEVKQLIEAKEKLTIIDVRSNEEFDQTHIPNAINIPLQNLSQTIPNLDKNYQYITACGKGGGRSTEGAKLLTAANFKANWLCGGTHKWLETN
jgi:MFS family permease